MKRTVLGCFSSSLRRSLSTVLLSPLGLFTACTHVTRALPRSPVHFSLTRRPWFISFDELEEEEVVLEAELVEDDDIDDVSEFADDVEDDCCARAGIVISMSAATARTVPTEERSIE